MTVQEFSARYVRHVSPDRTDRMMKLLAQINVEEEDTKRCDKEMSLSVFRDNLAHMCGYGFGEAPREWPFVPGKR